MSEKSVLKRGTRVRHVLRFPVGDVEHVTYGVIAEDVWSEYQRITVMATRSFGRVFMLDGVPQSSEKDDAVIRESFVLPALSIAEAVGLPRRALVLGAGGLRISGLLADHGWGVEGVEIDPMVLPVYERHFGPTATRGLVNVHYMDALDYIRAWTLKQGTFSLVLMALTDPVSTLARKLYSASALEKLLRMMGEGAILVGLADSPESIGEAHYAFMRHLWGFFDFLPYRVWIPTYGEFFFRFLAFRWGDYEEPWALLANLDRGGRGLSAEALRASFHMLPPDYWDLVRTARKWESVAVGPYTYAFEVLE